jgi:threonine synthase
MVDLIQVHGGVVVPLDITPKELWVDGRVGELLENTQKELGWFPITTVRYPYVGSPYYTEGYKSIAYELLEELGEVPDWVLVPVGSGEGLYGIWKGFVELRDLGRIAKTPKMAGVQARGAAPLVTAYEKGLGDPPPIKKARTVASGIEVMVSSRCALRAVKESGGCAIAVSDQEIVEAAKLLATREGLYVSPEGAAAVAGLKVLKATHRLRSSDCVVCITTASGIKYVKQAALHGKLALRCVPPELENIQRYVEQHFKRDW